MRNGNWLFIVLSCGVASLAGVAGGGENPCTNGSFEALGPNGFPVDWAPVGQTVTTSRDAHSGQFSLRLVRTAETPTRETGLNRGWRPGSRGGAMLSELRGGMDFWYKAISAEDAELNVYVIPMNDEPREGTGSPRAVFTVPREHVGDGRWHHARLKYDYTDNPKVKWVHFAARIVGTAGELLLDDISYVEKVGPLLRLGKITMDEDPSQRGLRATLRVVLENTGDQPSGPVRARLEVPSGLRAVPGERRVNNLAPEGRQVLRWSVQGLRRKPGVIRAVAEAGQSAAEKSFVLDRGLRVRSFGPVEPVAFAGKPAAVECQLENTGQVVLEQVTAEFQVAGKTYRRSAAELKPGQRVVLRAEFVPKEAAEQVAVGLRVGAEGIAALPPMESSLAVIPSGDAPPASGKLHAAAGGRTAVLENRFVRLVFFRDTAGFGPGQLFSRTPSGWQLAAWLPRLGRVVVGRRRGPGRSGPTEQVIRCTGAPRAEVEGNTATLTFPSSVVIDRTPAVDVAVRYRLPAESKLVTATIRAECRQPCDLFALDGPFVYVIDRREAVFPGLEWLVDDELSSDSLDIIESHADRIRYVPHPNKITIPAVSVCGRHGTVGMIWDVHQRWDGRRDRPAFVFASPDRFGNQRAHLMGLFLPGVPEFVPENGRRAEKPYPMRSGQLLELSAWLLVDGSRQDPLAAIDEYLRLVGLPEPSPLPHGSFEGEIAFSMRAYLESLWDEQARQWWTTKGNAVLSQQARPPAFVADLLLGEIMAADPALRRACRRRAEQVAALLGRPARLDAMRFPGRADWAMANPLRAATLLVSRHADGSWRFDADRPGRGPFEGKDYRDLGPHGAVEVGTCARNAYMVLSYARIAGDMRAYEAMRSTLELMERFRVPRAAQVWEVPVHTPDVLAAADAVDAYIEAYRISGQRRWLDDAVSWARRGLPFIYLWDDPDKPFLLGASIPVFGATWYRGSWFGRPVQWNGLRYANALLKLAEYDDSRPWRSIAERIIRSAIHQQDLEGENVALWPDNISAIDGTKCPWLFAPRQIIGCVLKLIGRDEEPATVIAGSGPKRLHLTSTARISGVRWNGRRLDFDAQFPPQEQGFVLVSNLSRPETVCLNGKPIPERQDVENEKQAAWRYDPAYAYVTIRIPVSGPAHVAVEPAEFVSVDRVPTPVEKMAFEFGRSAEGWLAAHHIDQLRVTGGHLQGRITGDDPYLVRPMIRVEAAACPVLRLRLRVTAGHVGQVFWTTEDSPAFGEEKSLRFPLQPDGQWHEYRLSLGDHPWWRGKTITGLRIDPGGGTAGGEFAVDYLRGTGE